MKRTTCLCLLAVFFASTASPAAVIVHSPVLNAAVGQSIDISATLSGAKAPVTARLYFRSKGKELYQSVEMGGSAFQVSGRIDGAEVGAGGVEYYLEVVDAQGKVTDPPANPQVNPHFISVRQNEKAPEMTILSPLQDDVTETNRPVITVAFAEADSSLTLDSVTLKLDGSPIPDRRNLQVFATLLSYVPSEDLAEGKHTASVSVRNGSGNASQAEWSFSVKSRIAGKAEKQVWITSGSVRAETDYGLALQQPRSDLAQPYLPYRPYGTNRGTLDVVTRGPGQTYKLNAYVTDEERAEQQPTDRYTGSVATDDMILTVGDCSPSFSVLSLYNLYRLRGVTLDLRSGSLYEAHSRMLGVWGQTRRGVDVAGGTPTYSQYLYGARYEWGMTDWLQLGFNGVSVSDDTGDIGLKGGVNPISNTLMTSDLKMQIKPLYLTLQGEGGGSVFAANPSVFGLSAGTAYLGGAHLNVLPSSTRADFEWRDLGGDFGPLLGSYNGIIPIGYSSAANPGLLTDYRGFESSFSQGLMENQVSFNLTYNNWRDDLSGSKPFATRTEYIFGSVNVAPAGLPYLNLGYGGQTQKNGANDTVPGAPFVDTLSNNINGSLGYTLPLAGNQTYNGTLSYVQSNFLDLEPLPKTTQDLVSRTYVVSLLAVVGATTFNGAYSLGGTDYSALGANAAYSAGNASLNLRASRAWIERVFSTYASFDFNGTSADDLSKSETSRSTYTLGGQYSPAESHRFDLSLSLAQMGQKYKGLALDPATGLPVIGDTVDNPYSQLYASLSYNFIF